MKSIYSLIIVFFVSSSLNGQSCTSFFSYETNSTMVTFINKSQLENFHYWWSFGDGVGSNISNPIHNFPGTGEFLVTLFVTDTIANCSDTYNAWITVTKDLTHACSPKMTDSIYFNNGMTYFDIIDLSTNCNNYSLLVDAATASSFKINWDISIHPSWAHAKFLSRIRYFKLDSNGLPINKEAYKSTLFNYSSNDNGYGDCTAGFEYSVIDEDSLGQTVFFSPMNSNAVSYEWNFSGFGNPVIKTTDTVSFYFPFGFNDMWLVGLTTKGNSGCLDTLFQQILVRPGLGTILGVGELNVDAPKVRVYPNPFTTHTTFDIKISGNENYNLTLFSVTGKTVKTISNIKSKEIRLDREGLKNGLYFYKIWDNKKNLATGKIIIQ